MGRPDHRTDRELLAATSGAPDAFGAFYDRYERAVYAYFRRHVADPEVSADLTAETFAAALIAARRFGGEDPSAASWLFTIAHRKLVSSWRRGAVEAKARKRLGMARLTLEDESLERAEEAIDAGRRSLAALLDDLPADQREAVRQHVVDERTYREISRELACSEAVVRQRVSRGLRTLRHHLSEETT